METENVRSLSEQQVVDIIEKNYGLSAKVISRLPLEASDAEGYVVDTGPSRVFLKPFPNYLPVNHSIRVAALACEVAARGAPLVGPVRTQRGDPTIRGEEFSGTLQHWLSGRPAQRHNAADAAIAIQALASFQSVVSTIPTAEWGWCDFACLPDTPATIHDLCVRWRAVVANSHPNLLRIFQLLAERVEGALASVPWDTLKVGWTHGDPGPENLILCPDGARLIDFDDMRVSFCIWDQVRMISEFAMRLCLDREAMVVRIDQATLAAGVATFQACCKPTGSEMVAWPSMLRLAFFTTILAASNLDWELLQRSPPECSLDPNAMRVLVTGALHLCDRV